MRRQGRKTFAGSQVIGMVNAVTRVSGPDTITGQFNCTATTFGASGVANTRGNNHSVAADPVNNQIYLPIAAPGDRGVLRRRRHRANGCIAVYVPTGSATHDLEMKAQRCSSSRSDPLPLVGAPSATKPGGRV